MNLVNVPSERQTILERASELQALERSIDNVRRSGGRLVLVWGAAGIGKSTILNAARDMATRAGMRTLRAAGSELERDYAYRVAIELLAPLTRDPAGGPTLFAGPAVAARPLFEGGSAPGVHADPLAAVHGLYWLVLNAAETGPLVMVVDDAQWADAASLRFLHYLGRRASDLPIVLVLAFRLGDAEEEPAVRQFIGDRSSIQLRPAPLSEEAVRRMLGAAGLPDDGRLARACRWATGGNPFYVTELIWELRRGALGGGVDLLTVVGSLVPERIARFVEARIGTLEGSARVFAEAVAVLDTEATPERAARLAGIDAGETDSIVRSLSAAAILAETAPLAFAHPIVRSAVYRSIPDVIRVRLHREAAFLLHRAGAAPGIVAAHLLATPPAGDRSAVDVLLEAARQARSRGDPDEAARKLRRALDEPPAVDQHVEVLVELGRAESAAHLPTATARYEEALGLVREPHPRAELLLELGHARIAAGDWGEAARLFDEGAALVDEDHPLRGQLEAGALSATWVGMADPEAVERRIEEILASRSVGPEDRQLATWIAFQRSATATGRAEPMADLVERAIGDVPMADLIWEGQVVEVAAGLLLTTDHLDREVRLLDEALVAAEAAGAYGKVGVYSYCRAWPMYYTGRLTDAVADAQAAARAADLGWEVFYPATCTVLALALIERGELDAADEAIAIEDERWAGRIDTTMLVPLARGRLRLARGDVDGALHELQAATANATAAGQRGQVPTESRLWAAEALVRVGRRAEARELGEELLEIAHRWGARWPLGAALRAAGLAEGGRTGLERLRAAVELLEDNPARLEHARALVDLGAALRRHGSLADAREVLGRGMDEAHRIGARALLDRSESELRAAGARPRRFVISGVEALTPAERRVARQALEGRTNREIAQALFVTPKAVEYHLANVYRKLSIGSRVELPTALQGSMAVDPEAEDAVEGSRSRT